MTSLQQRDGGRGGGLLPHGVVGGLCLERGDPSVRAEVVGSLLGGIEGELAHHHVDVLLDHLCLFGHGLLDLGDDHLLNLVLRHVHLRRGGDRRAVLLGEEVGALHLQTRRVDVLLLAASHDLPAVECEDVGELLHALEEVVVAELGR